MDYSDSKLYEHELKFSNIFIFVIIRGYIFDIYSILIFLKLVDTKITQPLWKFLGRCKNCTNLY